MDDETAKKSAKTLRQEFQDKSLCGFTLLFLEYFVFQRDFTKRHKDQDKHYPDIVYWTWVLDLELGLNLSQPGWALGAHWYPDHRRVWVYSYLVLPMALDRIWALVPQPSLNFELWKFEI